jgi:peptide/nickel transport system substrate-binding protein
VKKHLLTSGIAAIAALSLALTGCTPNNSGSGAAAADQDKEVKIMWNQPFFSLNGHTTTTSATANQNVTYFMSDSFKYYGDDLKLHDNTSFGTVEKISDNPMKVKYTIADTAKWSDGVPYTAADMILAWGARSGNFNTIDLGKATKDDGSIKKVGANDVVFNANDQGLALIKKFPEVSEDGKTVTVEYSKPFADWDVNLTLQDSGNPAHIVAKKALGVDEPSEAAAALTDAFKKKDNAALNKVATFWNTGYSFTKLPEDKDLLVNTGPYQMTEYQEGQFLTLSRRDDYEGERKSDFKTVTFRYNEDPTAAVQALQNGEVDLINPQATADILKSVQGIDGTQVNVQNSDTFEHIDLVMDNGGPFDPKTYGGDKAKALKVRQAFLSALPRQKIVDTIIKPLKDDATVRNSYTQVPGSDGYGKVTAANGMESTYGSTDVDKAKQLLADAGASKPKVRILYAKGNARREQIFQLIKESAESAGFQVIDGADAKWSENMDDTSKYDAVFYGWGNEHLGVSQTDQKYRSNGQQMTSGYKNTTVDGLYDKLLTETDPAKQIEMQGQIEKNMVDDAFGLPIFQFPEIVANKDSLQGVSSIPVAPNAFWNFWTWK